MQTTTIQILQIQGHLFQILYQTALHQEVIYIPYPQPIVSMTIKNNDY